MQRAQPRERARRKPHWKMRQPSSAAGPQPSRPKVIHLFGPYGVHVRNTGRGTWAAFVQEVRVAAGLSKVELARRIGVDRATVSRWETGTTRPEDATLVQRFAQLFALDLDETLIAAGLRPRTEARKEPEPPMDPSVRRLLEIMADPATTEETREQIVSMLRALNELAETRPRRPKRRAV